eukprot:scaffold156_cov308-Prasinococcus_capsulatus_cf.AAC.5
MPGTGASSGTFTATIVAPPVPAVHPSARARDTSQDQPQDDQSARASRAKRTGAAEGKADARGRLRDLARGGGGAQQLGHRHRVVQRDHFWVADLAHAAPCMDGARRC